MFFSSHFRIRTPVLVASLAVAAGCLQAAEPDHVESRATALEPYCPSPDGLDLMFSGATTDARCRGYASPGDAYDADVPDVDAQVTDAGAPDGDGGLPEPCASCQHQARDAKKFAGHRRLRLRGRSAVTATRSPRATRRPTT
jgi:hypothetical protein